MKYFTLSAMILFASIKGVSQAVDFTVMRPDSEVSLLLPFSKLASGDLDSDGDIDLMAIGNHQSVLYENLGGGIFDSVLYMPWNVLSGNASIDVVDVDGDMLRDLIVTTKQSPNSQSDYEVQIYLNTGNLQFQKVVNNGIPTSTRTLRTLLADFNSDGDIDLYLTDGLQQGRLYEGNGDGTFINTNFSISGSHFPICADFDLDGDLDLAVKTTPSQNIVFYENTGSFNFSVVTNSPIPQSTNGDIYIGNFIDPNVPMLLVVEEGMDSTESYFYEFAPNMQLNLVTSNVLPVFPNNPTRLNLVDINQDGLTDVWIKNSELEDHFIFVNTTPSGALLPSFDGSLVTGLENLAGYSGFITLDLDEDGILDVLYEPLGSRLSPHIFMGQGSSLSFEFQPISGISNEIGGHPFYGEYDGDNEEDLLLINNYSNNGLQFRIHGHVDTGRFILTQDTVYDFTFSRLHTSIADFTGDGIDDYLDYVIEPQTGDVYPGIHVNDGTGKFALSASLSGQFRLLDGSIGIESGDVDGDGLEDIVWWGNSEAYVYFQGANGSFSETTFPVNSRIRELELFDMDGDGDLDVLVEDVLNGSWAAIVYENSAGSWTQTTNANLANAVSNGNGLYFFFDFDNDGSTDILRLNYPSETVSLYTNTNGTFAYSSFYSQQFQNFPRMTFGACFEDFDNDGDVDILWMEDAGAVLHVNNGSGIYTPHFINAIPSFARSSEPIHGSGEFLAHDVDEDGDLDLILQGRSPNWYFFSAVYRNELINTISVEEHFEIDHSFLSAYPIPTREQLNIQADYEGRASYKVIDMQSVIVDSGELNFISGEARLRMNHSAGVYFVMVELNGVVYTSKVILEGK